MTCQSLGLQELGTVVNYYVIIYTLIFLDSDILLSITYICCHILGITNPTTIHRNLSYPELEQHERSNGEGTFVANGTFAVDTGKFTGRSPNDKWLVKQAPSKDNLWWGKSTVQYLAIKPPFP